MSKVLPVLIFLMIAFLGRPQLGWSMNQKPHQKQFNQMNTTHSLRTFFSTILSGNLDRVQMRVEQNPKLLHSRLNGYHPIHAAAASGSFAMLLWFLDLNPDLLEERTSSGNTLLHIAVQKGNFTLVQYLLEVSPNLHRKRNRNWQTPMHFLAYCKADKKVQIDIARYLYQHDPSLLNVKARDGATAADEAIQNQQIELAMWFYTHQVSLTTDRTTDSQNPDLKSIRYYANFLNHLNHQDLDFDYSRLLGEKDGIFFSQDLLISFLIRDRQLADRAPEVYQNILSELKKKHRKNIRVTFSDEPVSQDHDHAVSLRIYKNLLTLIRIYQGLIAIQNSTP